MNNITVIGNLTRDPELKFVNNGTVVCKITIAASRKKQDGGEEVSFINVVAFGSLAENIANTLHKGNRAIAIGRLDQRSWETEKGEKKTAYELTATAVGPELRFHTAHIESGSSGSAQRSPLASLGATEEEAF